MTTTVYADDIASAAADIADAGASVTFSRTTSTEDPTTGVMTQAVVTSSTNAISVKSNWQKLQALGLTLVTPQTIRAAAAGMTFAPQPGDTFVWADGFTYTVVNVEALAPNGQEPILYTIVGNR